MKDEYKKSDHYKNKMENFKLNRLMGRIKKKANGPNPLSCKRKKIVYENKQIIKESINLNDINVKNDFNNIESNSKDGESNEMLKKKRKRKKKNKINDEN